MVALRRPTSELEAEPLYCVYNPPMADNSQTSLVANSRFSWTTVPQLGSSTARVRLVPLDVSEDQEIPHVDLLSIDRDELLLIRRQLLQGLESGKKPSLLEVIKSKCSPKKGLLGSAAQLLEKSPSDGLINDSLS